MNSNRERLGAAKKPICARFLWALVCVGVGAARAEAQPAPGALVLEEHQVVERALKRDDLARALEGERVSAAAHVDAAAAYPNPELSYVREQPLDALGAVDDEVTLTQTIDISGRRGLRHDAAQGRARATRLEGGAQRAQVSARARALFYALLLRQERVDALESWLKRIDEALVVVTQRLQGGEAALYDRRRLEREQAVAVARLSAERAGMQAEQIHLSGLVAPTTAILTVRVRGTLMPPDDILSLPGARASASALPALRALDERTASLAVDAAAAERGWVPDLRVVGGFKGTEVEPGARSQSLVLGVALALPRWGEASALAGIARGELLGAQGHRDIALAEAIAALEAARAEATALRSAAVEFATQAQAASDLVRIAAAGYAGGELGLLELLDAYRGEMDDALTRLDLAHQARRARLDFDRLTEVTPP